MSLEVAARARAPIPLDCAFRVEAGEILALVGPSGSGKTTLIRTIAGLHRPDEGRVVVEGQTWLDTGAGVDLPAHRRAAGLVFQNYALFPHLSAAGNVLAAMHRPDRTEMHRILALVDLEGLADRRPAQLSGGQQQRVALARALARRPRVLLLDEPFSAVDRATRVALHEELLALRAHLAMPVVLVTHDVGEAQLLAERMLVLERGAMVAEGSAAQVMADRQALAAMGAGEAASLLWATLAEQLADGLTRLDTAGGALFLPSVAGPAGQRVRVRIMADDVILARTRPEGLSAQNMLAGAIRAIVPGRGPGALVRVDIGGEELLARVTRRAVDTLALAPGQPVHAIVKSLSVARSAVVRSPR